MTAGTTESRSTILVVEDEVGIARMIQVLLEARGFVALVSHSGSEALDRLAARTVDLVLLDLMMPGMDGYEFCRRLKADQRWRHIPVVMLTAKDTVRDKVLGLEMGADDYITKPFNTDELVARIKVLLRVQAMSQELVRRNRELQALNAVTLAVSRSLSLEKILDGALECTLENLWLEAALVHLVEPKTGHLVLAAMRGITADPPTTLSRVQPGVGWAWQAMAKGKSQVLPNAGQMVGLEALASEPPRTLIGIPLGLRERELGLLTVAGHPGQRLSSEDVGLLEAIGRQLAIALENSHLYADSRRKAREFEGLNQIGRAMAATFNLQEILTRISEAVSNLFHARAMSLMLLSSDGQALSTVAGSNLFEEKSQAGESQDARQGGSPSFLAVREKRPVAVPDLAVDDVHAAWLQTAREHGYRSFLAIPLIVQEKALGCMNLYLTDPHEFDDDEIQILSTFASQAAISIENARLFEEARQLAITDELTGLANHRQFYQQLTREVQRAHRYGRPLTLLMLDVDHFKEYNDRYGHLAGDHALRDLAYVMRCNARNVDILARYGGEEFAIILPETDLSRAAFQAERIRSAVAAHLFRSKDPSFRGVLTVSIGVTALTPGIRTIEELVHDADQAMYLAKTRGRNRVELTTIRA